MQLKKVCFCLLVALLPAGVLAGSVASMTSEQSVQGPDGESYLESAVDCTSSSEDRIIWRKEAGGDWCAKELSGFCSKSKIRAAKKVCDRKFSSALEDRGPQPSVTAEAAPLILKNDEATSEVAQPIAPAIEKSEVVETAPTEVVPVVEAAPAPEVEAAEQTQNLEDQQRQLEIEKERLSVEQQRLELRRQQVELRKEELAIQREIENKAAQPASKITQPAIVTPAPKAEEAEQPSNTVKKNVLGM